MSAPEEISVVVRVPLAKIVVDIRRRYSIALPMGSVSLEDDSLILRFGGGPSAATEKPHGPAVGDASTEGVSPQTSAYGTLVTNQPQPPKTRKRRRSSRNRMRTRGWAIVTKMANSKGQTVTIYEPFVEALRDKELSRREQETAVSKILRDNGNHPGRVSIDYYLDNTLEYLARDATT